MRTRRLRHRWSARAACGSALIAVTGSALAAPQVSVPHWSNKFSVDQQIDTTGSAIVEDWAVFDSGSGPELYATGNFFDMGGVPTLRIARYNGAVWAPVGSGLNSLGGALCVFDEDGAGPGAPALFVAGDFVSAGGVAADRIARWNGTSFSSLGAGHNGTVRDLLVLDEDGAGPGAPALFACGNLSITGPAGPSRVARWNGSAWSAVGETFSFGGTPNSLGAFDHGSGPRLHAGTSAGRVLQWDGIAWTQLGASLLPGTSVVETLGVYDAGTGPRLYAGGSFTTSGATTTGGIVQWNGTSWIGVGGNTSGPVTSLHVWNDGTGSALYVGGTFTGLGGLTSRSVARWNGTSWSGLNQGIEGISAPLNPSIRALTNFATPEGDVLLAGGQGLVIADFARVFGLARWNGQNWSTLGNALQSEVLALGTFDSGTGPELWAGGSFTTGGPHRAMRIARWDGEHWHAVGSGASSDVKDFETFDEDGPGPAPPAWFACGEFTTIDGVAATRIARWNGTSWAPLGLGLTSTGNALQVFDDGTGPALGVGGVFSTAGGALASRVARWNGTAWSPLGAGFNAMVAALEYHDLDGAGPLPQQLIAGGAFAGRVSAWNGVSWTQVGGGAPLTALVALASFDPDGPGGESPWLVATGQANGTPKVIAFNGTSWNGLGTELSPNQFTMRALAVFDEDGPGPTLPALFAGGDVTTASGTAFNRMARWNGTAWSPLASGMDSIVRVLHVFDDGSDPGLFGTGPVLIVGGDFSSTSGVGNRGLAEWVGSTGFPAGPSSFADVVLVYEPAFGGGAVPSAPYDDPAAALALPDAGGVAGANTTSLGAGGALELAFTDNRLANSGGNGIDLVVFTAGDPIERAEVRARPSTPLALARLAGLGVTPGTDGYVPLGQTTVAESRVDLDALFPGIAVGELHFDAVRLIDVAADGATGGPAVGADIDAVGAAMSVAPTPDLLVTAASAPATGETGTSVVLQWTVGNQGDLATAAAWNDRVYRSADAVLGAGDVSLGTFAAPGGLAVGASYVRSSSFALPGTPGTWYFLAVADEGDAVEEGLLDANNVRAVAIQVVQPPRPDLTCQILQSRTGNVLSGTDVSVTWRVTNNGTAATSVPTFVDRVHITPASGSFSGSTLLGSAVNPVALAPGAAYDRTATFELPHDFTGTFFVAVQADGGGAQIELDETNNAAWSALSFNVVLEPQPDLQVFDVGVGQAPPIVLFAGQVATVAWKDRNLGQGITDTSAWNDRVWLSTNSSTASVAGDLLLGTRSGTTGFLANGQEVARSLPVLIPPDVEGTRWIKVQADTSQLVSEVGGEANNIGVIASSIDVVLGLTPDLHAASIAPSQSPPLLAGHACTVAWSVVDEGFADWDTGFAWSDALYLSTDAVWDGGDVLLKTVGQSAVFDGTNWIGSTYSKTTSVTLPTTTTAGTYHLIVRVDSTDSVFEYVSDGMVPPNNVGESDNVATSAPFAVVVEPADLVIAPGPQAPAAGAAGQPVAVSFTVQNAGTGPTAAASWVDRVVLSANTTYEPGTDPTVRNVTRSGTLAAGANYVVEQIGTLPVVAPGTWNLLYVADASTQVWELGGEGNNVVSAPFTVLAQASDLVVSALAAPAMIGAGEPLAISWTVMNNGTLPTTASSWIDRAWLSLDAVLDGTDALLGSRTRAGALPAGSSATSAAAFVVPLGTSGLRYVILQTDALSGVLETDETNNTRATRMQISIADTPPANLVVDSVAVIGAAVSGQALEVAWTVRNAGAGPTSSGAWSDGVFLSTDAQLDVATDRFLGTYVHDGPMAPAEVRNVQHALQVPLGVSNAWFVIVHTNRDGAVWEGAQSGDNVRATVSPVSIALPPTCDLRVTDVQLPASATLGGTIAVAWTVTNDSGGAASGTWQDGFFLSLDDELDPGDAFLGHVAHTSGPLAVGASVQATSSMTVPGVLPGTYRVLAYTDAKNQIPEGDEDDNLTASIGTVTVEVLTLNAGQSTVQSLVNDQSRWYRVLAAPDLTLRIRVDHATASAWTELYASEDELPLPGLADFAFADPGAPAQELLVPLTHGQPIYVLVRATAGVGRTNQDATLSTEIVPFQALAVVPSTVGAGVVTLDVRGSQLNTLTDVALRAGASGPSFAATELVVLDASKAFAAFDLGGAAPGSYDLVSTSSLHGTHTLVGGVTVELPSPLTLELDLTASPSLRLGAAGTATARVRNAGNVNVQRSAFVLARVAGDDVVVACPTLDETDLLSDGARESAAFFVDDLGPGQSASVRFELEVGPAYTATTLPLSFAGSGRDAADATDLAVVTLGEALRQAVLADPASNAALLAHAASSTAWQAAIAANLPVDATDVFLPGTTPASGRATVASVAAAAASGLASVDQVSAAAIEAVSAALPCLVVAGTGLDCAQLGTVDCTLASADDAVLAVAGTPHAAGGLCVLTPSSQDPNEKSGPTGSGVQSLISDEGQHTYRVHFENVSSASAPAALVRIEDPLEPTLRLASFRTQRIVFGDVTLEVDATGPSYQNVFDLSATHGVLLQVTVGINAQTRTAFWNLASLDPVTGLPVADGQSGFLPPNGPEGEGEGHVEFLVTTVGGPGLTGTHVRNSARIVFDQNVSLLTNTTDNTVDADDPVSSLTAGSPGSGFEYPLTWSGSDPTGGAGLEGYTVYASRDGGPYAPIVADTDAVAASLQAVPGSTYRLYVIARDHVGKLEDPPLAPDAILVVPTDCNGNQVADPVDIALGTSLDCDTNELPDECQPDVDGDGAIDVCDGCSLDPLKTAPGACGCGVPDTDTDADGTPDCLDGCPTDPLKIEPGLCGCGASEADTDADGTPDCVDGCPTDPLKTEPGQCGCGAVETDTDADGTADCVDGCPTDPLKTAPGACGCGVPDTDTDGDGRADCVDNCPGLANPAQADCDLDGTGDACEIAAGAPDCNLNGLLDACDLASGTSSDLDGDGVPDECASDTGFPFCSGDGVDAFVTTPCPCQNSGSPGHGCANSVDAGGALLDVAGATTNDSIELSGSGMPAGVACIYLQGDALTDTVFGDGVRCAGGTLIRLRTKINVGGSSQFPEPGDPSVSTRGQVVPGSGAERFYQAFYRNPAATFCPPETFNVTNGIRIVW